MASECFQKIRSLVSLRNSQLHSTPTEDVGDFELSLHSVIGSQSGRTNTLLLTEIIFGCLSVYNEVTTGAIAMLKELDEHEIVSDFQLLVLLLLVKLPAKRKLATALFFNLVAKKHLNPSNTWTFLHDLPELTLYFKHELKDLAYRLLIHQKSKSVIHMGALIYAALFNCIKERVRQRERNK